MRQRHVGRARQDRVFRGARLQEENYREFTPPLPTTAAKFSCGPGDSVCFDSESGYALSIRVSPFGPRTARSTIPSPSARNATAKRGSECPQPIACYLPPGEGTLTHAFANSPLRTQRTSMRHRCWIVAQHSVARPVGGLRHRKKRRKYRLRHPRDDGILSTDAILPIGA